MQIDLEDMIREVSNKVLYIHRKATDNTIFYVGIGNPIQNQGDANTSAAASGPRPSSSPSPSGQLGTLGISDDDSYTYSDE